MPARRRAGRPAGPSLIGRRTSPPARCTSFPPRRFHCTWEQWHHRRAAARSTWRSSCWCSSTSSTEARDLEKRSGEMGLSVPSPPQTAPRWGVPPPARGVRSSPVGRSAPRFTAITLRPWLHGTSQAPCHQQCAIQRAFPAGHRRELLDPV